MVALALGLGLGLGLSGGDGDDEPDEVVPGCKKFEKKARQPSRQSDKGWMFDQECPGGQLQCPDGYTLIHYLYFYKN